MRGVITRRDVLHNLGLIAYEFGLGCALRCVVASLRHHPTTFLDVALKRTPHR